MRNATPRVAVVGLLLAFVFGATLFTSIANSQKKRKRFTAFPITVAKIRKDVVGKRVYNLPSDDGRRTGDWIFVADELKEIAIVERSRAGSYATVTINMKTGDRGGQVRGKIRLNYERIGQEWTLTDVENLTFKLYPYNSVDGQTNNPFGNRPQENNYPQTANQPRIIPLLTTAFAVPAGRFVAKVFNVPPSGGRVVGWFRATGGRNDIRCWIIPEIDYDNVRNNNAVKFFYDSNWITVTNLNVPLAGGSYYIIFDNRPAVLTSKAVTAQIVLQF